jgi:aspartate-semialdehyde dehydrogenase
MREYNIAIVGATGVVGESLLEILSERKFPVGKVYLLASDRSSGVRMQFGEQYLKVSDVEEFDFSNAQIAFFSAGSEVSAKHAPRAAEAGCVVIDNTSYFRYDADIPLIIPEVNPSAVFSFRERNIIANPNCSTIQMLVALKPIYDAVGINRIQVATYQSVSGAGKKAIEELARQTASLLNGKPMDLGNTVFGRQIAFNVIPEIDEFQPNGYTKEEMKMVWETQKILEDVAIEVSPTAVRVPVFFGHSESVSIETRMPISVEGVKELLRAAPGVQLCEEDSEYPTAISDAAGTDPVYVGRIRADLFNPCGLNLWIVADNIRKGAALNAIQIAELLVEQELI